nr:MAG TPA: ASCH domain protein [Caudoviricetes sp.]
MAIKPILFNTEMVRAILDGRKSCTRRLVKPQPDGKHTFQLGFVTDSTDKKEVGRFGFGINEYGGSIQYAKPQYQPGDILYVRETWERFECWNCEGDERGNCPKEPKKSVLDKTCGCYMYRATDEISGDAKWHPSIHMPKEAARIWLKVTDVRVERLQDITEDGAEAEGMPDSLDYPVDKAYCPLCKGEGIIGTVDVHSLGHMDVDCPYCDSYRKRFENLWNSINQKSLDRYGWDANPWVWVIEFEWCEKPEEKRR